MLRFFRVNDPYRLVFIFIILVGIRTAIYFIVPGFSYYHLKWLLLGEWLGNGYNMYQQTYDYTGPMASALYKLLNLIFGKAEWAYYLLSTLLITAQSAIFNSLLIKNKVYEENSYLPAFLYAILATSVLDFMALSPQLLSLTFILLTLRNVVRRISNQATDELFLSSGVYIGIAAMIHFPSAIFLLVFLFALILFSSPLPRRILLYLFGFFLVFSLFALYYYTSGSFLMFFNRAIVSGFLLDAAISYTKAQVLLVAAPFIFILIVSLLGKAGRIRLTNFQQKVEQVLWLIFFGAFGTFFLSNENAGLELVFLVPIVAYYWVYYFILLKRRIFKALMPFLLLFGLIFTSFYSYKNLTQPILVPEHETIGKVMVIGEKLEAYSSTTIATPFFNGVIASQLNEELDSYEGAGNFYQLFETIEPEYIIDELDVMQKLRFRFPEIEKNYQQIDSTKYKKINN